MTDALLAHFVDGSDVQFAYLFYESRVEMSAYDEKARRWYDLTFADCVRVDVMYSDCGTDAPRDLSNLTDGVEELEPPKAGIRGFRIGFADDTVVEIWCREFKMGIAGRQHWSWEAARTRPGAT